MPHLRLELPQEWLREDFVEATGFDARKLLDHLVEVVAGLRMENAAIEGQDKKFPDAPGGTDAPEGVLMINKRNLQHALVPVYHSGVGGDLSRGFLHLTFAAGNDTPGRTGALRRHAAETLGNAIDLYVENLPGLGSVTVHVQDIDRERGYSTTAERKRQRGK